jgi:hypothetical protein
MINEKKVILMTKLASYEEKQGQKNTEGTFVLSRGLCRGADF